MSTLIAFTDEELRAELARRTNAPEAVPAPPPEPRSNVDWSPLRKMLTEYATWVASDDYHEDNDWTQYIYEQAVTCVFGDAFFEWMRKARP